MRFLIIKKGSDLLSHQLAVPSALLGLTSLFGMGRGGPSRYGHENGFFPLVLVSSGMITTPDLMKLIHKATADTALPGVGEV